MPPLETQFASLSEESNHSVYASYPHEEQFNGRRQTKIKAQRPISPQSSPSDTYALTKNALDAMEASIGSVLRFLSKEGVSRASIKEMLAEFSDAKYVAVMERAHQYAKCVAYRSQSQSTSVMSTALRLMTAAWEALAKYLALQYRQAHRHYHTLRRMGHIASVTESQVEKALKRKLDLAEQCCSSQKGLLLAQAWERRVKGDNV